MQSDDVPFKIDEGFSEDMRSLQDNGHNGPEVSSVMFQQWVMGQSEEARAQIAYEVLRTLRTSTIAAVVERLTPLLHMDPVTKLPPEVTSIIFSNLPASTLLTASLASRAWRERILDSSLWKELYAGQGWGMEVKELRSLEASQCNKRGKGKAHMRTSDATSGEPQLKRRATGHSIRSHHSAEVPQWREQHGKIEADTENYDEIVDYEMQDAPGAGQYPQSPPRRNKRQSQHSDDGMSMTSTLAHVSGSAAAGTGAASLHPPLKPSLLLEDASAVESGERINWSFLYKQRRRLEENWSKGRFTNFQLPHPQHLYEAHTECVYTIQFFGRWLVSGSRDKTLRIWDLDTRRLRGKPLHGHSQSVLCLQFDPTEEEDVIISGSSDTSVIVWRFSDGQKIHEIPQAHTESVLNLRFDKRYLVTCSKDKLIKIWNRKELSPLDPDYPRVSSKSEAKIPAYIVDLSTISPSVLEARMANRQIKSLLPYTQLMVLDGHAAAVNAIQIDQDQIVSASGDRNIKIWNVKDGRLVRTLPGHQKGIACVQFDSKRIVSGSSDNTVRIYDPSTGAEVSVLLGHTNLVRTVQAGFGDVHGVSEDLEGQARQAERDYIQGLENGTIKEEPRLRSRRNPTSRHGDGGNHHALRSFGAALPPGGGGSQWGRIVSGSYDETIIIWKKDGTGRWVVGQTLRQEAAVRASAAAEQRASQGSLGGNSTNFPPLGRPGAVVASPASVPTIMPQVGQMSAIAGLQNSIQNVMNIGRQQPQPYAPGSTSAPSSSAQSQSYHQAATSWLAPGAQQAMHQLTAHAQNVMQNAVQQAAQPSCQSSGTSAGSAQDQTGQTVPPSQPQLNGSSGPSNVAPAPVQQPHPVQQPLHHQPGQPPQQQLSRVFKLQFDARRIVCCSQDSRIIGWDFSNGDEDIIEASRFFLGP
jgi:F-box and WD-40 domain protein 1/11